MDTAQFRPHEEPTLITLTAAISVYNLGAPYQSSSDRKLHGLYTQMHKHGVRPGLPSIKQFRSLQTAPFLPQRELGGSPDVGYHTYQLLTKHFTSGRIIR